jgi:hypothetical protein
MVRGDFEHERRVSPGSMAVRRPVLSDLWMVRAAVLTVVVALIVTLWAGITADDSPPSGATRDRLPAGVDVFDVTGSDAPDFVRIDGEVLPVAAPSRDPWWVPFVPFFATLLSAVIAAGVGVWTHLRPSATLDRRIQALEEALGDAKPPAERT